MNNIIKYIIFFILLMGSLYFCVGGMLDILVNQQFEEAILQPVDTVLDGDERHINYKYKKASNEYDLMVKNYPIYFRLGEHLSYILTLFAFGILGGFIRILSLHFFDNINIKDQYINLILVFGGIIGFLTILVNFMLPEFKDSSSTYIFYYLIALLAGLFTKEFILWLKKIAKNIFSSERVFSKKE